MWLSLKIKEKYPSCIIVLAAIMFPREESAEKHGFIDVLFTERARAFEAFCCRAWQIRPAMFRTFLYRRGRQARFNRTENIHLLRVSVAVPGRLF